MSDDSRELRAMRDAHIQLGLGHLKAALGMYHEDNEQFKVLNEIVERLDRETRDGVFA